MARLSDAGSWRQRRAKSAAFTIKDLRAAIVANPAASTMVASSASMVRTGSFDDRFQVGCRYAAGSRVSFGRPRLMSDWLT